MKKALFISFIMLTTGLFAQVTAPPAAPPPPPPAMPDTSVSSSQDANMITITDSNGDTYVISGATITKNGEVITDMEELEKLEDITDADIHVGNDTLPDSTAITIGKWRVIVKEKTPDHPDGAVSISRIDGDDDSEHSDEDITETDHDVDHFETDWLLFSMGYNTYVNSDFKTDVPDAYKDLQDLHFWGSFDVNLGIFKSRISPGAGYMNISYGINFEWHHFRFDDDFTILPNMDTLTIQDETTHYDKNKFNTTHLTIPVYLGFESKPWDTDNSFRLGVGYDPGLLIKGKTKHKIDGKSDVAKDHFNLAPFQSELDAYIGYGHFTVYASYDLNSMFSENEGPELHPVAIGLVIHGGF